MDRAAKTTVTCEQQVLLALGGSSNNYQNTEGAERTTSTYLEQQRSEALKESFVIECFTRGIHFTLRKLCRIGQIYFCKGVIFVVSGGVTFHSKVYVEFVNATLVSLAANVCSEIYVELVRIILL